MAGGHQTFPSRLAAISENAARAAPRAVPLPAARQFLFFVLGFSIAVAAPANMPSPTASRVNATTGVDGLAPQPAPEITLRAGIEFRPRPETALFAALRALAPEGSALDRIARAVEAAESTGGTDPLMWRSDPDAPQGPMQVSRAAADVGGGNRWDMSENRALGRAYLAKMYERFGNWTDAVTAYNWGPSSLDLWIRDGRPGDKLVPAVAAYRDRIMRDAGLEPEAADSIRLAIAHNPVGEPPIDPLRQAELQEEKIRDAGWRHAFHANSEAIRRLQGFLDATVKPEPGSAAAERARAWLGATGIGANAVSGGDAAAARLVEKAGTQLVLATIRSVAGRPGYEVFDVLAKADSAGDLKPDVSLQIASVLLTKLRSDNAMILLLDASKHARPSRMGNG
jgi:hypothetical protein